MTGGTSLSVKSASLSNGPTLQYVEQGDPSGIPVLLLHGYTDSFQSFSEVLPHLPDSIHVFALTLRGHGDSDRPETGYAMRDFAADTVAFMDALGIESAILVGHSLGSIIAMRAAMDYPERVLGLVLVAAGFTPLRDNPGAVELWDAVNSSIEDQVDPEFVREFQMSMFAHPAPPAFLEMVVNESLKVPARVWRAALQGAMDADMPGDLEKIRVPALIIWGDQDIIFPRSDEEALAAGISGSRLVVYEGIGHGIHWEEPERFAADLAEFSQSIQR